MHAILACTMALTLITQATNAKDLKKDYTIRPVPFTAVEFQPVETQALRLEAELQDDFSGGILEWRVNAAQK